ncbi:MAG: MBL fold metallo-hydrolase [Patescibacteria group bacterium]
MDIIYLGHSSFKIKGKKTTVVTDPFDSALVGIKFPATEADIVTVSHNHDDHNKTSLVDGARMVLDTSGEYEIGGTSFIGISSYHDADKGAERGKNTIFVIEMDGLRLCHLGDLGHKLTESALEEIGNIDILFIPVGGVYTIDAKVAAEVVSEIDPRIIIPMHYWDESLNKESFADLAKVDVFLSEIGLKTERLPKLSIKAGEISSEDQVVYVLDRK